MSDITKEKMQAAIEVAIFKIETDFNIYSCPALTYGIGQEGLIAHYEEIHASYSRHSNAFDGAGFSDIPESQESWWNVQGLGKPIRIARLNAYALFLEGLTEEEFQAELAKPDDLSS